MIVVCLNEDNISYLLYCVIHRGEGVNYANTRLAFPAINATQPAEQDNKRGE